MALEYRQSYHTTQLDSIREIPAGKIAYMPTAMTTSAHPVSTSDVSSPVLAAIAATVASSSSADELPCSRNSDRDGC